MDALLPSEVARLVLGYLQEQKCEEAARMFMDTSPLLHECRIVAQRGGRYSTKVGGLSLTDILDKYCAANAIVQEKLEKVSDSEQLKQCNDLIEQLRYLLEGSRGHRFVVNINVPTQNSPNGLSGSPVSGSSRKKHHSNSERGKRIAKSLNNFLDKSDQVSVNQVCDTVEATPLESLPGHKATTKQVRLENNTNSNVLNKSSSKTNFVTDDVKGTRSNTQASVNTCTDSNSAIQSFIPVNSHYEDQSTKTVNSLEGNQMENKCTAGTSTKELINYCSAEVQTGQCDLLESESEVNYEPVQNLSILTKQLLKRTELHERLAEQINRAIIPVETSFREETTHENQTEANISLLTDFDNAIKSVVEATETDPIFEGFLKEVFNVGEDTSDDSDTKLNKKATTQNLSGDVESMELDFSGGSAGGVETTENSQKKKGPEIPLKQRLRSSSKSINNTADEEEKENTSVLEDQNEEAVMSIVANVIANQRNSISNEDGVSNEILPVDDGVKKEPIKENMKTEPGKDKKNEAVKPKKPKKPRKPRAKPGFPIEPEKVIEEEKKISTVPALIICTENECHPNPSKRMIPISADGFLPIAPKPRSMVVTQAPPEPKMIYLRTVNVPRHLVNPAQIEASNQLLKKLNVGPLKPPPIKEDEKVQKSTESITLYSGSGENNIETKINDVDTMNLDESPINIASGTGLTPFFKDNINPIESKKLEEIKKELLQTQVEIKEKKIEARGTENLQSTAKIISTRTGENGMVNFQSVVKPLASAEEKKLTEEEKTKSEMARMADAMITKRTPKSLMKDRSKNNRLSLSTPRRRNSHVRALDFNTPVKLSTTRKISQSCTKTKSVCRAGLFKSPPFSGNENNPENANKYSIQPVRRVKTISPVKSYLRIPIATRSPAPKLQGNWNKVTGIGMILGETSTESSPEKIQSDCPASRLSMIAEEKEYDSSTKVAAPAAKKSWDSDLRLIVGSCVTEQDKSKKNTKKTMVRRRIAKTKNDPENKLDETSKSKKKEAKNDKQVPESKEKTKITPPPKKLEVKQIIDKKTKHVRISPDVPPPVSRLPNMLDLETPKKVETTTNVPPTPRVTFATPGNSLMTSDQSNLSKDLIIKDCVNTPDFPVTPCIVHTPKIIEEDNDKKPSPYYEPSEEPTQVNVKEVVNSENVLIQKTTSSLTTQIVTVQKNNFVELQESKTIEITKFGIIEENQKIHEDKEIESTSEDNSKEIVEEESIEDTNASANSDSESDSDSDSNSSTSSSSSDSSSSDSSSSTSNVSSPTKSLIVGKESQHDNSTTESEFDSPVKMMDELSKVKDNIEQVEETSPTKQFSVLEQGEIKETPAKDESNSIPEAVISETPSVSGTERASRFDTITNLTSKISAMITTTSLQNGRGKPKILRVQTITQSSNVPPQTNKKIPQQELQQQQQPQQPINLLQHQIANDAKLSQQLEEKRLRMLAKIKESANPKPYQSQKKVTIVKKNTELVKTTKSNPVQNVKIAEQKVEEAKKGKLSPKKIIENNQESTIEQTKSKVDQVKRDLFSDEEVTLNDQRTTRSQTNAKKTVDNQSDLPGVLECLQLIPTNKPEQEQNLNESDYGLSNNSGQGNTLDISLVYDDSVPIKKRKRKYSSSELENEYVYKYPEEEIRVSVSALDEVFKLNPKNTKKKSLSPKKTPVKVKKKSLDMPLATSSPLKISSTKKSSHLDSKKKKTCKRKASPIKEDKQVEKKSKPDPRILFNKIKIDEFLKSVHVPE